MTHVRIAEDDHGFRPQYKGWIFWHDFSELNIGWDPSKGEHPYKSVYRESLEKAKEFLEGKHSKSNPQSKIVWEGTWR